MSMVEQNWRVVLANVTAAAVDRLPPYRADGVTLRMERVGWLVVDGVSVRNGDILLYLDGPEWARHGLWQVMAPGGPLDYAILTERTDDGRPFRFVRVLRGTCYADTYWVREGDVYIGCPREVWWGVLGWKAERLRDPA